MKDFNPKLVGFSYENALALLEACELAYRDEKSIQTKAKAQGFDQCEFIDKGGTQAYIAKNKDLILVAFRGTEQEKIEDLLTDLLAWKKKIFWGTVHVGFYNALDFVFADIARVIKKMQDNRQPIWLTGHSLGGALATLTAARLAYEEKNIQIQGIYTFGQPLIGDPVFKTHFDQAYPKKMHRVTNFLDPISLVPLQMWRFDHVGEIVLFNKEGKSIEEPSFWVRIWLPVYKLIVAGIAYVRKKTDLGKKNLAELLVPHAVEVYRENIERNIGSTGVI